VVGLLTHTRCNVNVNVNVNININSNIKIKRFRAPSGPRVTSLCLPKEK
jgi:hypothetical protein